MNIVVTRFHFVTRCYEVKVLPRTYCHEVPSSRSFICSPGRNWPKIKKNLISPTWSRLFVSGLRHFPISFVTWLGLGTRFDKVRRLNRTVRCVTKRSKKIGLKSGQHTDQNQKSDRKSVSWTGFAPMRFDGR